MLTLEVLGGKKQLANKPIAKLMLAEAKAKVPYFWFV